VASYERRLGVGSCLIWKKIIRGISVAHLAIFEAVVLQNNIKRLVSTRGYRSVSPVPEQSASSAMVAYTRGARMFALTLARSSSLVAVLPAISPRWRVLLAEGLGCYAAMHLTALSHRFMSSSLHCSGSLFGSGCAGNMSPLHIDHAATAVTTPAKPKNRFWQRISQLTKYFA
jgi:hypothetical protein